MALFTSENAAIMQRRAIHARLVRPVSEDSEPRTSDEFRREQLAHVRAEIVRVRKVQQVCEDPKELQAFATALSKLFDVEQKLSMRPSPGQLKPVQKSQRRAPLLEIMPIASPVEQPASPPLNDPNEPNG